jgi:TolB protein
MKPDGTGERILTTGYLVEGASWAPNGKILVYTKEQPPVNRKQKGASEIHTIDIMGFNERVIATKENSSDPSWSSLLS